MSIFIDTSIVVAAIVATDEHHPACSRGSLIAEACLCMPSVLQRHFAL